MNDPRMTPTNDAPVTVERKSLFEALRRSWFGGRQSRGNHYDSEAIEADWNKVIDRLAALASAPAPSWSETPEHIRDHLALLAEVELHLQSSRVFVTSREKMHPCGVELHDELLGKVTAAIETIGRGQAHG